MAFTPRTDTTLGDALASLFEDDAGPMRLPSGARRVGNYWRDSTLAFK